MKKQLLLLAMASVVVIAPCSISHAMAQTPSATSAGANLEFVVASIRQNKTDTDPTETFPLGPGNVYTPSGGVASFTNYPLINYIAFAYKLNPGPLRAMQHQLPPWVTSDRFDIKAKTDKHDATKDEMRLMMRALLAERFKLVIRSETQQVPVYTLVQAKPGKTGPQLVPHPLNASCSADPSADPATDSGPQMFPIPCGGVLGMPPTVPGRRRMGGRNVSLDTILLGMSNWGNMGKPLLNQTGLSGKYDFAIEWVPDPGAIPQGAGVPPDASGSGFLEALQEQLGLKLVPTKGPSVSLIIDHVEPPSEN